MTRQVVNIGSAPNARDGDPDRQAFTKINANFLELYTLTPWPLSIVSVDALDPNDPVRLTSTGSPPQLVMEKADATDTTKPATGFVLEAVPPDTEGGYFPLGVPLNSPDSPAPFAEGVRYYLAVGGGLTASAPTTPGQGVQEIGIGFSDSLLITSLSPMGEVPAP